MAYMIGGIVGAALFAVLISRLLLWLVGFLLQGSARIWTAYGVIAVLIIIAAAFGHATMLHAFFLVILLVIDLWRQSQADQLERSNRRPIRFD